MSHPSHDTHGGLGKMHQLFGDSMDVIIDGLNEGGAGEVVRKKLMETTELHTILRLPTGTSARKPEIPKQTRKDVGENLLTMN